MQHDDTATLAAELFHAAALMDTRQLDVGPARPLTVAEHVYRVYVQHLGMSTPASAESLRTRSNY